MYRISRVDGHQRIYQTLLINHVAASEGIMEYISTFCTSSVTVLWSDPANVVISAITCCAARSDQEKRSAMLLIGRAPRLEAVSSRSQVLWSTLLTSRKTEGLTKGFQHHSVKNSFRGRANEVGVSLYHVNTAVFGDQCSWTTCWSR